MTATALKVGGDEVQQWAEMPGALAGGGVLAEATRALFGRRSQRVVNVSKLEALATSIAEKATASADKRVADVEREVALLKDRDVRRRVAMAAHGQWDEQLVAQLRELGVTVPPPPPLEVA